MYVFNDEKKWIKALAYDLCFEKACMVSNLGEEAMLGKYKYYCSISGWSSATLFARGPKKDDYFNKDLSYETLSDDRDGSAYKTIKIGEETWMAENLNFSDSLMSGFGFLQDGNLKCNSLDTNNCEMSGRMYTYTGAMNISSSYKSKYADTVIVKKIQQGVCPEGWHVPDTLEWSLLSKQVNGKASALKSLVSWSFYSDKIDDLTNSSGFSAVMAEVSNGNETQMCTATQYSTNKYYVQVLKASSNDIVRTTVAKSESCYLRCLKDKELKEENPPKEKEPESSASESSEEE